MPAQLNPRKSPCQRRSRATVEAILDAAARILAHEGLGAMNTNRIAETAGVSIGSLYQYFPNKEAVLAALHERHGEAMHALIATEIGEPRPRLADAVRSLVGAVMRAHLLEPELHRVLETREPMLLRHDGEDPVHADIRTRAQALLERHRHELTLTDLPLATYMVMNTVELLVHTAVIDPPAEFSAAQIEQSIVDLILRYLTGRAAHESAP